MENIRLQLKCFSLYYEEAPPVDTFVNDMLVSFYDAYVLIDTSTTHTCIFEEFMSVYSLTSKVISDSLMCVNTPLSGGSILIKVCRVIDVLISDVHMPIDMLVLPISGYDVVLGMNCFNKYRVSIDCLNAELSFDRGYEQFSYTLVNQRLCSMVTMELWQKPLLAAMSVDELMVVMVPVMREFIDVFLDNLPGLPPD